jgi:hypothetical protein
MSRKSATIRSGALSSPRPAGPGGSVSRIIHVVRLDGQQPAQVRDKPGGNPFYWPGGVRYRGGASLYRLLQRINTYIVRWARNKYRRLGSFKKAKQWWTGLIDREPGLFAHWAWISTFGKIK